MLLALSFSLDDARIEDTYRINNIERWILLVLCIKARLETYGESVVYKLNNEFGPSFHVLMRLNDISEMSVWK